MSSPADTHRSRSRAIVVALVGLAYALQLVWVPLHLAWDDHHVAHAGHAHAHAHAHAEIAAAHGAHVHVLATVERHAPADDGAPRRAQPDRPEHDPHPAADHADELAQPAVLPRAFQLVLALAPAHADAPVLRDAGERLHEGPTLGPRPPPPRAGLPARAPPLLV